MSDTIKADFQIKSKLHKILWGHIVVKVANWQAKSSPKLNSILN